MSRAGADLCVNAMVFSRINLKTTKAVGLTVPASLIARAG